MEITLRQTSCPVCDSRDSRVLFEDINRREGLQVSSRYCRCSSCSTIFLNPTLDESSFSGFDDIYIAPRQPERGSKLAALAGGINNNTVHGWLHRLPDGPGHGKRILDVGCSSGEKLVTYRNRGFEIHGVDLASRAIDVANKRFGGGFHCGSLESARYEDSFFDCVRMDSTLEHINRPLETMREILRILKPGGTVYVYVPNGESLLTRLLKGRSINSWIPFHVVLYTPDTLTRLLRAAGFTDIRTVTHTPPGLLTGTLSQAMGGSDRKWVDLGIAGSLLGHASLPVCLLLSVSPCGEELVAAARKS